MRNKVGDAVKGIVETEVKKVSFDEAVKLLNGKLDIKAARYNSVKQHGRWGLLDALVKTGVIKNISDYEKLFTKATFKESDLLKVCEMIDRGEKILPIFDPGEMTPNELFAVLFTESAVPHSMKSFGFKNLDELRRINPNDILDLENLAGKSYFEQYSAFETAYKMAPPLEKTGPRILFTVDILEVTHTGKSATQDMQAFTKGEMSFLDPSADFLRYRAQIDAGLSKIASRNDNFEGMTDENYRIFLENAFAEGTIDKYMPDSKNVTRYPNYAFKNGGGLCIFFRSAYRQMYGDCSAPDSAYAHLGSRISLG